MCKIGIPYTYYILSPERIISYSQDHLLMPCSTLIAGLISPIDLTASAKGNKVSTCRKQRHHLACQAGNASPASLLLLTQLIQHVIRHPSTMNLLMLSTQYIKSETIYGGINNLHSRHSLICNQEVVGLLSLQVS